MSVVVQKYGGSSVATPEKIKRVAERIARTQKEGHAVCVVVSAMGDTTDELLALARRVTSTPDRRELDMLLTSGERISMALLALALHDLGVQAISFTGSQSGIITTDDHSNARIIEVRPVRLHDALEAGRVVIVAGYQGVSRSKEVTTLGRGGSDTTAVALAAALQAEWCEICSDVDGVYTSDPRVVPEARRLAALSYDEMQALAEAGARVLNAQAVEFAKDKGIAIHARATFSDAGETVIRADGEELSSAVRAVTSDGEMAIVEIVRAEGPDLVRLCKTLDAHGIASRQLDFGPDRVRLVVSLENAHRLAKSQDELRAMFGDRLRVDASLGSVSCVGAGVGASHKSLDRALRVLSESGIAVVHVVTTSLRIDLFIARERLPDAVRALHKAFIG